MLISSDSIDTQMAGPGIRYWEFANHLSKIHEVILLTPNASSLSHPHFQILQRTKQTLKLSLQRADVVVTQGYLFPLAPLFLADKPLIIDLYDPLPIELLEQHLHLPLAAAQLSQRYCVERTKMLLRRGDVFLYSNERQRDYWLGMLTAVGRINHHQYRKNRSFTELFRCVPYGISDDPLVQTKSVLRGNKGICSETDTVVLWGGGLWKWFDPCSVIQAMKAISQTRNDIKLFFLATRRAATDSTGINVAYAADEAITLSQQLELYNRSVFFNQEWVPYTERQNYFLEANIGISTHHETLETHFAFRTRLLDYLWAGLPMITTTGDSLSELIERFQLGIVVAPFAVQQIRDAIMRLTDDHVFVNQCRENIQRIRKQFFWSEIIKPLDVFCAQPYQTCSLNRSARRFHLLKFYANTGIDLIQYRGYSKILAKIRTRKT